MRIFLICLGHLCVLVGLIGIPLPLLPTTPFLLLAAWCYSKGSQRFHDWLTNHPRLGPPMRDWQTDGVIRPRAKWLATGLLCASMSYPLLFGDFSWTLKLIAAGTGIAVLTFIHSRPSAAVAAPATPSPPKSAIPEGAHPAGVSGE